MTCESPSFCVLQATVLARRLVRALCRLATAPSDPKDELSNDLTSPHSSAHELLEPTVSRGRTDNLEAPEACTNGPGVTPSCHSQRLYDVISETDLHRTL
ncbi:hypothetical protein CGGC5_v004726 [Colletotrichum fructicola Nara gc5]|uniref:Uncharacterized protein n=1 Tax=Colletotrichum fructicola (strain Nara gc5) TaxID=1213859 RepID=A0A7J6JI16_COLFN|nr:hypothetical protein CGGC5_v004726 [Colletotrichum fructicola Nara gc5]